ncbi:hypothetical protein P691DRAFT_772855 [Macrolepiota fuliginosa MF-IS2]|uniref:Uncharacterized protein n=1 Tax=Macrolepiota fuliginosa MF-IS2 TaxID=1400762 RepID=A0A9P6C4Y2_9AGAR|nr:hypothetical protein P691DRAFT_772855 [Macrolepiota fuliginosa MF-IS2]
MTLLLIHLHITLGHGRITSTDSHNGVSIMISHVGRIAWLKGPGGAGKSIVAQYCAEALEERLGASFFFSRPNDRDDPHRFFTSISIRRDPTLVGKSVRHQFRDLPEAQYLTLSIPTSELAERVIIVNGRMHEPEGTAGHHEGRDGIRSRGVHLTPLDLLQLRRATPQ